MTFSGKVGNGPTNKLLNFGWWRYGSPSGYKDFFPDSSLLGDTESCINRLRCATLHCRASTISRHCHSNYDVIASPAHDRHALAEVCIDPVLLVCFGTTFSDKRQTSLHRTDTLPVTGGKLKTRTH